MLTEILAVFFNVKEHGELATYTQQGGGTPKVINVIFEADYYSPLNLVQSEGTTIMAMLADIPNVKDGDAITCRGNSYIIRVAEKDWGGGEGLVMLRPEDAT